MSFPLIAGHRGNAGISRKVGLEFGHELLLTAEAEAVPDAIELVDVDLADNQPSDPS
ncbi:hypothetical protein [Mycolicibacterium sphagni]|uniref:hypothetical protein n=1 Tax=Mycolicibacterium sphagni TaxID=1786 RepID=UPI0021F2805F|nr:hypothetical protein [Mycolicibacterium sphagni]MCV7174978.1 hypothetical protein [Mycolicibacterium sphagni]